MTEELLERNTSTDDELVFIREFDVPKSLVFQVFTEDEHMKKWKGSKNYSVSFSES